MTSILHTSPMFELRDLRLDMGLVSLQFVRRGPLGVRLVQTRLLLQSIA